MTFITGIEEFLPHIPQFTYYIKESGFLIKTHIQQEMRRKQGDWVSLESLQKYLARALDKDWLVCIFRVCRGTAIRRRFCPHFPILGILTLSCQVWSHDEELDSHHHQRRCLITESHSTSLAFIFPRLSEVAAGWDWWAAVMFVLLFTGHMNLIYHTGLWQSK